MNLSEPQRRALRNARDFLALDRELHPDAGPWHAACRMAITDILAAFKDDLAEGEEPAPCAITAAAGPGWCTCGAHVTHSGQVIPAGTAVTA